jgi:TRAP-type C4-dicarboxylate transport system permease small subunit
MTRVIEGVRKATRGLHGIGGVCLVILMLITVADVVLRAFRRALPGTYELVGFAGALAIGFALPCTSWMRGHVYVDSLVVALPRIGRMVLHTFTRVLAIGLFAVLGWNLVLFGLDLRSSGEVSPTLELHFYPIAFGLAAACLLQVVVLLCNLVQILRGEYE